MLVDQFDYVLPPGQIAQEPRPRGTSRLCVVSRTRGGLRHETFSNFPDLLRPGDLLVRNNARVIPARLLGETEEGRPIELFILKRPTPVQAICLTRPGRRARAGARIRLPKEITACVSRVLEDGRRQIEFSAPLSDETLEEIGHVPLPPYIRRPDTDTDRDRYQTVFATQSGAVAAPTAGLHFTNEIFARLRQRGVEVAEITLLVGVGTFKPVTVTDTQDHRMDTEEVRIAPSAAAEVAKARSQRRRIVAVGTTVTRALESWVRDPREHFETSLFITPGFDFQIVDALLTNFHLPRSTLLMLVCAFAGQEKALNAYREAVKDGYLFYSYGDAMLIE